MSALLTAAWVIVILLTVACLAMFIVLLVIGPKKVVEPVPATLYPQKATGFKQTFERSNTGRVANGIEVATDSKPLSFDAVVDNQIKPAFVFTTLVPPGQPALVQVNSNTSMGFTFAVTEPITVVGLQVIDVLFDSGSRQVGIYDMEANKLLLSDAVSKENDAVELGFRNHFVAAAAQVNLVPNTRYACVGLVLTGDRYVQAQNYTWESREILMNPLEDDNKVGVGFVGSVVSSALSLPTNFTTHGLSSPFASLLIQQQSTKTSVFQVDTQYASFPLNHMYGLVSEVLTNAGDVTVTKGTANVSFGFDNVFLAEPITTTLTTMLGADAPPKQDTWYAIFLLDIADGPILVVASENFANFKKLTKIRRIGWVRTKPTSTDTFLLKQTSNSIARLTKYIEPAQQFQSQLGNGSQANLILTLVPPTAIQCTLEIEVQFPNPNVFQSMFIDVGDSKVAFYAQGFQVQHVSLPIVQTSVPSVFPLSVTLNDYAGANPTVTIRVLDFTNNL